MKFSALLLPLLCLLFSCTDSAKEEQLKMRESELQARESNFVKQMQDYESLKMMRDSLRQVSDSAVTKLIPAEIIGKWNGKMICTESSCSENAVGDIRSDTWEFRQDSVFIVSSTGSSRSFGTDLNGSELRLIPQKNPSNNNRSEVILQLPSDKPNKMKGMRELLRDNCTSRFSVDLEKTKG